MIQLLLLINIALSQVITNKNRTKHTESMNVTLKNYEQILWTLNISIGYPAQQFEVELDTGSSMLWVPLDTCKSCQMKDRYNSSGQETYRPTNMTYTMYYGEGYTTGVVATDKVALTGSVVNSTMLMQFSTSESGFANSDKFDGIMGLSNNHSFINIFQVSATNGQIETDLYAVVLNQMPMTSYLLFGQIDKKLMNEAIWVTTNDIYRWKLFVNHFVINNQDYSTLMGTCTSALIDSGTSYLLVTYDLFSLLLNEYLVKAGCLIFHGLFCQCRPTPQQLEFMPNITISFNQVNVTIPFYNLIQGYFQDKNDSEFCEVSLGYITGGSFMTFGDPIFLSFIPIFNKTSNQIGFVGGDFNGIPNGNYTGEDEIDESY